jgi:hypothetical protein
VETYNLRHQESSIVLNFSPLGAGYGEHFFNQIAREIISANIAVFDASDRNPNVVFILHFHTRERNAINDRKRRSIAPHPHGWLQKRMPLTQIYFRPLHSNHSIMIAQ